jgi:predicted Zn-dependent protease
LPAGAARSGTPTPIAPIRIGITDADLFTERTDFLFSHAEPERRRAVVSTRRLKEAFWKRKSNPALQQTRLVREIIGAVALAAGAVPCESPNCAASHAKSPLHVDQKTDRLCPVCERKVRGGSQRI